MSQVIQQIVGVIPAQGAQIVAFLVGLFSVLSAIAVTLRLTRTAKVFGTFAGIDWKRVLEFVLWIAKAFSQWNELRKWKRPLSGVGIVFVFFALQGCALFRQPLLWDVINAACESDLAKTAEAQAKAKALGVPLDQVVEIACKFADVIEPYVRQQTAVRQGLGAPSVTAEAVAAAKARGVL